MSLRASVSIVFFVAVACGRPSFVAPESPPHNTEQEGALHAARFERPFSCGSPDDPRRIAPCPIGQRPPDPELSCDAIGCHGGYDYSLEASMKPRDLTGSEGPSCYTCHGEEWNRD